MLCAPSLLLVLDLRKVTVTCFLEPSETSSHEIKLPGFHIDLAAISPMRWKAWKASDNIACIGIVYVPIVLKVILLKWIEERFIISLVIGDLTSHDLLKFIFVPENSGLDPLTL